MEDIRDLQNKRTCDDFKEKVKYIHNILDGEFNKLYEYQLSYFCLLNTYKNIIDSSNIHVIKKVYEKVSSFGQLRNSFLIEKMKVIRSYIHSIDCINNKLERLNNHELEQIDDCLRYMLISVGLNVPNNIFKEPF